MKKVVALLEKSNRELEEILDREKDRARLIAFADQYLEVTQFAQAFLRARKMVLKIKNLLRLGFLFGPTPKDADLESIQELYHEMMAKILLLKERIRQTATA